MLYLIGGPGRTGKSLLARRLVVQQPMLWTSTDVLYSTLRHSAPELGLARNIDDATKERLFMSHLESLCDAQIYYEHNSVVEGDVIHPGFVDRLRRDGVELRACFLGWSSIDQPSFLANQGRNAWLTKLPEEEQQIVIRQLPPASEQLEQECEQLGLPYVDMAAGSFDRQQDVAVNLLLH